MRARAAAGFAAAAIVVGGALTACEPRADLVVTKSADTNDGRCDSDCSLREAVVAANSAAGADFIRVPSGLYELTRRGKREDASATGDLDIHGDVVIAVEQGGFVSIDGSPTGNWELDDRILDIQSGTVEVRGIGLEDGRSDSNGGIIQNSGRLTLVDVRVDYGYAFSGGGGIASGSFSNTNVSLTLIRTSVTYNRNTEEGAGIQSSGRLTIIDSTIERNTGGPGRGMGIETRGDGEIRNTIVQFNGNRDGGGGELCGGGIYNAGALSVRDSRITNNGGESGAGILNGRPDCRRHPDPLQPRDGVRRRRGQRWGQRPARRYDGRRERGRRGPSPSGK
jgi:CSLREA domain-containing protein